MKGTALLLPLADGTSRPATTPAERAFSQVLNFHAYARRELSAAVKLEAEARSALVTRVAQYGPVHSDVQRAKEHWREACSAKKEAAARLERANAELRQALGSWEQEAAASCAAGAAP